MGTFTRFPGAVVAASVALGFVLGAAAQSTLVGHAQSGERVFEIRTYTAVDGKLHAVNARFRDHTTRLFRKHGLISVGYWTPMDPPASQNTLIYVLAHPSRDAAKKNWDAFRNDPDWKKARAESEVGGPIVSKIESVFVRATDYSPLR